MEGLKIVSGGKLLKTRWVYDEDKDEGNFITEDVTDHAPSYLFESCTLEEGVVLKDIFQLLQRHLDIYKIVIGNWVDDYVKEGLKPYTDEETELKYLELYWHIDDDKEEGQFSGNIFPYFHGIGIENETPYSLIVTPANEIAELPLKMCQEFTITNLKNEKPIIYKGPEFSLGQILYGIIWELSWFGSPEMRDEEAQQLLKEKEAGRLDEQ